MTPSKHSHIQSMQTLKDPELYQWHFFSRWFNHESQDIKKEHDQNFFKVLKEAINWAGKPFATQFSTQFSTINNILPLHSERIASADWREYENGMLSSLEARTLLDAFYIQCGQARKGDYESNVFGSFVRWIPKALDSEPIRQIYLGEAVCLCAEVNDRLSVDMLSARAVKIAEAVGAAFLPGGEPEIISLSIGFLIPLTAAKQDTFVVLYPSSQSSIMSRFVHYTLPQILLSRQKALHITNDYHQSLLTEALNHERLLDSLLKKASKSKISLEELEQLNSDISRQQAKFVGILSTVEDCINTMHLNLDNLELLLNDTIWNDKQQVYRQLMGILSLQMKQMEAEHRYMNITLKQADIVLQNLQTQAGIHETRWGRRITVLLGLFGITGAVIVFQDVLPWYWRFMLLLAGVAIVYWLIYRMKGD